MTRRAVASRDTGHLALGSPPPATLDETLHAIIEQVRRLFDPSGCAFVIVDPVAGRIEPKAAWFASGDVGRAMRPILGRAYDPARPGLTEAAVEGGRPIVLCEIARWPGSAALRTRLEERLEPHDAAIAWRWYQQSCLVACPVRTAAGRVLGVLEIAAGPERPIGDEDLRAVEALAGMAALALERSELLDREAARASEEALLRDALREITASLELERVHRAIVVHARRLSGAGGAVLRQVARGGGTLRVVAVDGLADAPPGAVSPLEGAPERALAGGRPVREGSWLAVPIALGPRSFAVLSVTGDGREESRRRLEALAPLAAGAIANALDHARERRLAEALSRGFVPSSQPELAGVEVGTVYDPAELSGSGGDFFGLWRVDGERLAILVGDVSGKGLEVSASSAMVRFFIEARLWDRPEPMAALEQANALLCARGAQIGFATAFLGVLDEGCLRYANAGHVPPLLRRADGTLEELAGSGLPLGVEPDAGWHGAEVAFGPEDLLFAATDGLVEARREGALLGEQRIRELLAASRELSAQELVERAHAMALAWGGGVHDDIVVLAVRRR